MNRIIPYFLLFFLLLNCFGYTQTFEWAKGKNGTSSGTSIGYDKDGNVICSGSTPTSCFIEKHSDKGDLVWSKSINNASIKTKVDSLGNIYALGGFYKTILIDDKSLSAAGNASYLAKFNSSGTILWLKSINDVYCEDICLNQSGFYVAGASFGTVHFDNIEFNTNNALFIAKYDESGKCIWVKTGSFNANGDPSKKVITTDNLGNIYCISQGSVSFNFKNNRVVSKFNSNGEFIWAQDLGGDVTSFSIIKNTLYISGNFIDTITIGDKVIFKNRESAYIIKMQDTGFIESFKVFDASYNLNFNGITIDPDENIYVAGRIHGDADFGGKSILASSSGGSQVMVAKFNSLLEIIWAINSTCIYSSSNVVNAICYNKINNSVIVCGMAGYEVKFGNTTLLGSTEPGSMFISKITDTSIATGIEPHHLDPNLISFFPNPSSGIIKIENQAYEANTQIFVRNILGYTLLQRVTNETSVSIDLSGYPKGIYFIDVLSSEGKNSKKIVLQ
jgi:hypothetical protein